MLTRMSSWPKVSTAWSTRSLAPSHELTSDALTAASLPARLDELDDLLGRVLVAALALEGGADVVDDDLGALRGQQEGLLPTDPPTRAGDDGDLAVEHSHDVLLYLVPQLIRNCGRAAQPAPRHRPPGPDRDRPGAHHGGGTGEAWPKPTPTARPRAAPRPAPRPHPTRGPRARPGAPMVGSPTRGAGSE